MSKVKKSLDFDFNQNHPVVTLKHVPEPMAMQWPLRYQALVDDDSVTVGDNYPWYAVHNQHLQMLKTTTVMNKLAQIIQAERVENGVAPEPTSKAADEVSESRSKSVSEVQTASQPANQNVEEVPATDQRATKMDQMPSSMAREVPAVGDPSYDQPLTNSSAMPSHVHMAATVERGIGGLEVTSGDDLPLTSIARPLTLGIGDEATQRDWSALRSTTSSDSASSEVDDIFNDLSFFDQDDVEELQHQQAVKQWEADRDRYTKYLNQQQSKMDALEHDLDETITYAQFQALQVSKKARVKCEKVDQFIRLKLDQWDQAGTLAQHIDDLKYLKQQLQIAQDRVRQVRKESFNMAAGIEVKCRRQLNQFQTSVQAHAQKLASVMNASQAKAFSNHNA